MAAPSNPINAKEYGAIDRGSSWTPDASYAVGTESDRLLLVYVQAEDASPSSRATGVSFNTSESFTKVIDVTESANHGSLWALVNPSNATAAIIITFSENTVSGVIAIVWYHSDAEQVVPSEGEASNSNSGTSETAISVDIITSGSDRMIVAGGGLGDANAMAAGSGETLIHEITAGTMAGIASYFVQASAGTRAMDYTFSSSRRPNIVGVAILPVVAVGGRIMSSLAGAGGLAGEGGIAGQGGGLAG